MRRGGKDVSGRCWNTWRGLCREVGARTIWLTVNRRNERAIGAYRRAGFREVRAQVTDIGGGYVMDDYIMELETTPQKE